LTESGIFAKKKSENLPFAGLALLAPKSRRMIPDSAKNSQESGLCHLKKGCFVLAGKHRPVFLSIGDTKDLRV